MQPHKSVWQGSFGYWQAPFIHEHVLPIGHCAWSGFLQWGRGMVVCDVELPAQEGVDWSTDLVPYQLQFLPERQAMAHLQNLDLEASAIAPLCETLQAYAPDQAVLLLLKGRGQQEITLLNHLKVSPPECYRQLCDRRAEFVL